MIKKRLGDSATRRLGDSATRRLGDSATRRLGDSATRRLLLFAGRTSQALARLRYDVEPCFNDDPRIRTAYALIPGSRFASSAPAFAARNGIDLLSWETACELGPDLIVTSSPDPCLYEAGAPVISMPHGAGHNRLRPELSGVSGLSPEQIRGPAGQVPDFMALPGLAALRRLAVDCPEALPHAEVCGDVCLERLRVSAAHRAAYREALGIGPDRRLVVLSSTWDSSALVRRDQTLPERLHGELPMDEFALVFIPHPNDDLADSPHPTGFLRPHLANGLIMVPPDEGWRAALVAADCLIGDHGSVSVFGAAIGVPTMSAAFGFANMPPELPLARFGRAAPRFDRSGPAALQLRKAISDGPLDFDFTEALAEPEPGPSARLHAAVYRLLDLPSRALPRPLQVPDPVTLPECSPISSWRFALSRTKAGATWNRFPVSGPTALADYRDGHLVADAATKDQRLIAAANVLLRHRDPVPLSESLTAGRALLERYPVGRVASVRVDEGSDRVRAPAGTGPPTDERSPRRSGRSVVLVRGGPAFLVEADRLDAVPSLLYERLVEHPEDAVGLGAAVLAVGLQGEAEPVLSIVPFEE